MERAFLEAIEGHLGLRVEGVADEGQVIAQAGLGNELDSCFAGCAQGAQQLGVVATGHIGGGEGQVDQRIVAVNELEKRLGGGDVTREAQGLRQAAQATANVGPGRQRPPEQGDGGRRVAPGPGVVISAAEGMIGRSAGQEPPRPQPGRPGGQATSRINGCQPNADRRGLGVRFAKRAPAPRLPRRSFRAGRKPSARARRTSRSSGSAAMTLRSYGITFSGVPVRASSVIWVQSKRQVEIRATQPACAAANSANASARSQSATHG